MLTPKRLWIVLTLLALSLFPVAPLVYNHLGEDCFITFRYVEQWSRGKGLVFNVGERVEGYSNFLWLVTLAALKILGGDILVASRWLSVAAHASMVWVLGKTMASPFSPQAPSPDSLPILSPTTPFQTPSAPSKPSPIQDALPKTTSFIPWHRLWTACAVWLNPLFHYHADRGLETLLFTALLSGAMIAVAGRQWLVGGILLGLVALTRPEGIFYTAAFLPLVLFEVDSASSSISTTQFSSFWKAIRRRVALFLAPALLAFGGQLILRWGYYGSWLPNTVIAKLGRGATPSAFGEILRWGIASNGLPALAWAGALLGWLRLPERRRLIASAVCLYTATLIYQVGIGHVPAAGYRYLIPAIAPVLLLVGVFVEATHLHWGNRPWIRRSLPLALLLLAFWLHPHAKREGAWFTSHGDALRSRFHHRLWESVRSFDGLERWTWYHHEPILINANAGRWLKENLEPRYPNAVLAADQMGQLGYFASWDQHIIDLGGLMDAQIAREGVHVDSILRRNPDFLVLYGLIDAFTPLLPELQNLVASPAFQERYQVWWRIQPRDRLNVVEFVVWGKRLPEAPAEPQVVKVGPSTAEFERWWRVLETPLLPTEDDDP